MNKQRSSVAKGRLIVEFQNAILRPMNCAVEVCHLNCGDFSSGGRLHIWTLVSCDPQQNLFTYYLFVYIYLTKLNLASERKNVVVVNILKKSSKNVNPVNVWLNSNFSRREKKASSYRSYIPLIFCSTANLPLNQTLIDSMVD